MIKVRLLKDLGKHTKDSVHEVSEKTARRLVQKGDAEAISRPRKRRARPPVMPEGTPDDAGA